MKKLLIRLLAITVSITFVIFVYGLGGLAGQYKPELVDRSSTFAMKIFQLLPGKPPCSENDPTSCGFSDTQFKQEVSCRPFTNSTDRQAVIFAFGQSNSANWGEAPYMPLNKNIVNFNPYNGKCYKAEDPLLGADGNKGSVWLPMADQLIQDGLYDRVLIASFGIGGTEIARWAPDGDLHVRIKHTAKQLLERNLKPTHVLWHQGEADAVFHTSKQDYVSQFSKMALSLREYGIDAPIFPAVATHCGEFNSPEISEAQYLLADRSNHIYPGANTDKLVDEVYRYDNCHFSVKGLKVHAQLWVDALKAGPSLATNQIHQN